MQRVSQPAGEQCRSGTAEHGAAPVWLGPSAGEQCRSGTADHGAAPVWLGPSRECVALAGKSSAWKLTTQPDGERI